MENKELNFKEKYLKGELDITELDDYIGYWHDDTDLPDDVQLIEYLGLTDDEYTVYVMHGEDSLKELLDSKK